MSKKITSNDSKRVVNFALVLAPFVTIPTLFSPADFHEQTVSFVALSCIGVALMYVLVIQIRTSRITGALAFLGQHALYHFVFSWAVLYKILDVFGALRSFDLVPSLALTVILMALFTLFVARKPWRRLRPPRIAQQKRLQELTSHFAIFIHKCYNPEAIDN